MIHSTERPPHYCETMSIVLSGDEYPIAFTPKFREYGLQIQDGGSSSLVLHYCPWCAAKLPESLRDRWFDELYALDIDPHEDEVPSEFTDSRWYRDRGL
jgi:uncharacterized protein DUF6980